MVTIKKAVKKFLPNRLLRYLSRVNNPPNQYSNINLNDYYLLEKSKVTYAQDLLYTFHNADFMKEEHFLQSYRLGKATDEDQLLKGYDIHWRTHVQCWAAFHASHLDGDFVECGAHTGIYARSIINFIDFAKFNKTFFLLDTFEGMDERYSSEKEMERSAKLKYGQKGNMYEKVKHTFRDFNVQVIKGTVPETLPLVTAEKVCYLSIDMNSVYPEVAALEFFWEKLVSGALIVLDDYGYANLHNEQKAAHDKFAKSKGVMVLTLPTCQGLIIKP